METFCVEFCQAWLLYNMYLVLLLVLLLHDWRSYMYLPVFCSARQHIGLCRVCYMLSPVRLSVRLSHGWISQKWLKLGSCNFHHKVARSLWFLRC